MKKTKRVLALILALLMVWGLSACGETPPVTTEPTGTQSPTEGTEPEITVTCQYLPKTVDNPDNLPVLKWVCLTEWIYGGGKRTWSETAAQELNQMLADRNMPYRVQFVMLTMDQWLEDSDWFSRPEAQEALKDADLIYGMMRDRDMQKYLTPITEHVIGNAEPSLKNSVAHEKNWLIATVEDDIWGVPTLNYDAYSNGWIVDADLLTAYGISEESFSAPFWEMDETFEKIYEANGKMPFLFVDYNAINYSSGLLREQPNAYKPGAIDELISQTFQYVGSCFAVDFRAETPKIINILDSDVIRNIHEALLRYIARGYNTSEIDAAQIRYDFVVGDRKHTDSMGYLSIPVTSSIYNTTVTNYISGVAAVSEHQADAVSLMNLIAEDETFRMQLFYGKEGRDYTITNGYYTIMDQADGSNYSLDMLSPLSYFCGLTSDRQSANLLSPGTENWYYISYDGKTSLQTYQDRLDNCRILGYPITFDYSAFEQEIHAMETVFEKYFPQFTEFSGEVYEQMIQELKDAGNDKVQAELQRQLEQWQKENPDW